MKRPHYSLRTALLIFVLLPLLGITALTGWLSLDTLERQIEGRMQEDIELIARAIRLPVSYAKERGREGSVSQALDSVFRIGRVYGAYLYDADGAQVAASGPRVEAMDKSRAARLASEGDRQGEFDSVAGEEIFSYFVPLTDSGGQINGLLQVTRRGSDFQDYITRVRYQALGLLAVMALVLMTVVLYGHHRAVGAHFGTLLQGMARIGSGERAYRVPVQGPYEVRRFATGMNEMLDNLMEHERTLAEQRAEQAALEDRLRQSEKMAAVGRLAAGVAHELGAPLNVIDGQAQRALRGPALAARADSALQEIRGEVRRMSRIVRQLMDFGRSNPLQLRYESPDRLVRAVCARFADLARERMVHLEFHGPTPAPKIRIDRVRMEQALSNLVSNALQAATGQVRVGWLEAGDEVGFLVEDDGPGIPEHARDRIFEPFFTTKSTREGTGLGLAVAHAAVTDHGGRIEVDRGPMGGARFRLILARERQQETSS